MDFGNIELSQQTSKEISGRVTNRKNSKKFKTTIYLTEEEETALTELYIHHLRKNRKIDRSMIVAEAILKLYHMECC